MLDRTCKAVARKLLRGRAGVVGKLARPNAGRTRKPRVFFVFALPLKINEKMNRKLMKSKRKTTNNRQKSSKIRSWVVLGAQGRFQDASGRARDGSGTVKSRPKGDFRPAQAIQERPGGVPKRARAPPKTPRSPPREPPSEFFARQS